MGAWEELDAACRGAERARQSTVTMSTGLVRAVLETTRLRIEWEQLLRVLDWGQLQASAHYDSGRSTWLAKISSQLEGPGRGDSLEEATTNAREYLVTVVNERLHGKSAVPSLRPKEKE